MPNGTSILDKKNIATQNGCNIDFNLSFTCHVICDTMKSRGDENAGK